MTVKELIQHLNKCNPDALVLCSDGAIGKEIKSISELNNVCVQSNTNDPDMICDIVNLNINSHGKTN